MEPKKQSIWCLPLFSTLKPHQGCRWGWGEGGCVLFTTSYVILRLDCSRMGGNLGLTSAVSHRRKAALGRSAFSSCSDRETERERGREKRQETQHERTAGRRANGPSSDAFLRFLDKCGVSVALNPPRNCLSIFPK